VEMVAAPWVYIDGDGYGAVAVAEFDSSTRKMTGIKIVAPGVGYTRATAVVIKTSYYYNSYTCTIGQNANTGSFTKKGEGDFSLNAANTWGGDTVLKGGTLRLGADNALPSGTTVVYEGGELAVADGVAAPAELNIRIDNPDPTRRYTLMTFEGGAPATMPTVNSNIDDPRWTAARVGNRLTYFFRRGSVVIFK